jgi:hypothetical protein
MPSSFSGNQVHSVSTWFRYEQTFGDDAIFSISPSSGEDTNKSIGVRLNVGQDFQILYYHWSNDIRVNFPHGHTANTWYHMVVTYTGSITDERRGKSVYINGELCPFVSETTTGELNLDGGDQLQLARRNNGTKEFFGSIANFRVFNRALTSDEIWQLYAYQKEYFGHGDLGMTLKAGRLGIGTSEPKAALDVRGGFQCGNSPLKFFVLTGVHPDPIEGQNVTLPDGLYGTRLVSITGVTVNTNGDTVPFERHSESSSWEVDVYYNIATNVFHLSSQGSGCPGKEWRMFVVTT